MERPRKRVHDVQGGEDTDHDGSEGKRPRPSSSRKRKKRATFSCSECKRRKIKCDRQLPCDQCIAREEIDLCEFKSPPAPHDAPKDPPTFDPRQSELLQSLASRVAHLEHLLSVSTPTHLPPTPPSHPASHTSPSLSVARSGLDSDTEDAVLALENLAKGNGVSVNYGKLGHRPLTSEAEPVDHAQGPPDEQKVPSYDWTETSTSIFIREPFNTSDVVASDFLARSLASLKGSDEQILDRIYAVLPPPSIAKTLIDLRFDRINWLWNVQHRPTFLNECEQFWGLRSEDRARVDPAWLALYAQTLALGANADADSLPDECVAYLPLASGQAHILWFETSKLALELAKWAVKPQFRVIQTIILFGPLISPIGSAYAIRRCFSIGPNGAHFGIWLAAAIRLAQMMGLHKLGNDTAIMPPNDLAFPPRPSGLRREMGVRLWNFLLLLDWKASKSRDFIISPLSFTTTIPANCDDEDLTLDDVVVHPKPAHRMTDMVHMIYARALFGHCSDIASILRSPQGVSYDNILDFDAQFRKQANPLLGEGLLLPENRDVQHSLEKRAYIRAALHNRLLRLHRPFMVRAFRDPLYQRSHAACLESAEVILLSQSILRHSTHHEHRWCNIGYILGAVIVLFLDTINRIDTGQPEAEGRRAKVHGARCLLDPMCRNEHGVIVEIACKGRQIIDSLLEEETMRRETQARRPSGPRDPDQVEADAESLRSLFKRVAAAVSTVRVPSNGISTLAPVNSGPDSTGSSVPPVGMPSHAWDNFLQSLGVDTDTPPAAAGLASVEPREDLLQQTDWDMFTQEAFSNPAFGGFGSMF